MKQSSTVNIIETASNLRAISVQLLLALALAAPAAARAQAQGTSTPASAQPDKPAPLPLHEIEGSGGIFSTLCAYIVNPPRNGEAVGRPSAGFAYVHIGNGRELEAFTLTETPWERLELGYGSDTLNLGDLPQDVERATGVRLRNHSVRLDVLSARLQLFLTSNFALAAEYRQKPDEYRPIGSLVKAEADWLTFDAAYVINNHLTVAAGYGHFGDVLNHTANGVWGITNKFEF
jgi:hypothetical protein